MSEINGKSDRKKSIERVVGDHLREPSEKETILRFDREEKLVHVNSFDSTIIKGLLKHKLFEVDNYSRNTHDMIIGVSGHLPRGVLKIKNKPRKRDYSSTIISTENTEK